SSWARFDASRWFRGFLNGEALHRPRLSLLSFLRSEWECKSRRSASCPPISKTSRGNILVKFSPSGTIKEGDHSARDKLMHATTLQGILEHLRKLTNPARDRDLSDADLLERFHLRREEAAFTLLVQRHGPMVLAICRRILGDVHEAE